MNDLGCGLYTGAAYTPISKTFSVNFEGCGLYTGNYGILYLLSTDNKSLSDNSY